jgi:hypothetical protein
MLRKQLGAGDNSRFVVRCETHCLRTVELGVLIGSYSQKGRKQGLIVRIQVDYSRAGNLLRYSLSLIDLSSTLDNGRIVGYDNAHEQHHRHYFGRVDRVEFESYEKLESQFEAQVRQYLETGTC